MYHSIEVYSSERRSKSLDIGKVITKTLRRLSIGEKQKEPTSKPSAFRIHYGVGKRGLKNKRRRSEGDKPLEIDESNDDFNRPGQHSPDSHNAVITANQDTVTRKTAEKRDR
jgi:hypothetical protein